MEKNGNNIVDFQNPFNNLYFLDYETDSNFLEWYTLEGSERINELSRQLRTFLNYKSSIICLRFSGSQNRNQIIKNDNIIKQESELFSLSSRFTSLLKKIGVEEGGISEKIQIFIDKVKTQPKNLEIKVLKEIKMISSKIWKILHILSEMELQNYYKLLNITIKLASILCNIEAVFFTIYSDFYGELKHNYLQLEKELSILLCLNEDEQFETKEKKKQVRILE